MGVQVGNQCFSSQQAAENYLYSQVTPILTENGVLAPVFNGNNWTYNGQIMHSALPECSATANFMEGQLIGWALVTVFVLAWKFRIIQRML